ncbi:outer membrane lipoprotein-sorting protein [Bacteriovoracaceae bacterium]|nr:outer membrane lipoprotein-sorting protein [Bacteriovoracaceae bacterium]
MKHLIFFTLLTASSSSFAAKIESLLNNMDRLYKAKTSIAVMEMTIITSHWQRTLKMKAWSKGLEHSFITIQEPKKDKGIATLKIENKMWNYFPKINKVIKVPPSMMMGAWMGSDFTNDDLVKENTYREDNTFKFGPGNKKQYQIILKPKPKTVTVWGRVELWLDKKTELPIKEEFFDEKGEKNPNHVF